ncbi:MAG: helix-turn-helix transcriptional regulator [Chloroflexi bacterium]|nr:MAG: helix-turn-helix transcriptional regulator [Chloroflexota bacterium]
MAIATDIIAALAAYAHGRVPRAIRERQILALAEDLFAEQGYANASMDELARRAGVSKPVIYALVGSKEQLYRRCVERHSEILATRIATAPPRLGSAHVGRHALRRRGSRHPQTADRAGGDTPRRCRRSPRCGSRPAVGRRHRARRQRGGGSAGAVVARPPVAGP